MLLYNLLMAGVDLAALECVRRKRHLAVGCGAMACAGMAAVVLAVMLGRESFEIFRLTACGLLCHGAIVPVGSAVLLWRTRPKTAIAFATAAALVLAVAVDAFLIEPTWLEVSRVRLTTPKIARPVRIVVLADLQTDQIGSYERRVLKQILDEKPDLILLAGDYIQAGRAAREELGGQLNALLHQLGFAAPAGVFAVGGNIDGDWPKLFDGLPVTSVRSTESFQVAGIRLTCLGVRDSFSSSLEVGSPAADRFHVVLGHSPNFALGRIEADLLVAGHTHGGQVRLPLIGPLVTLSRVPRRWAAGLNDLPGGARLLVSRGVGMERGRAPRIRFLCRPELVVIDLAPKTP
jgi:predicted MPP superfamily phosphohydrolase